MLRMTKMQRRVVLVICLMVGLTLLVGAGLTFLVAPMAESLGLADDYVEDALVIPAIASLLVVFVAGRMGDTFGDRRSIVGSGFLFSIGAVILAAAQGPMGVNIGLALCGVGTIIIQIVGVSLLQKTAGEGPAHVSAFTTYGMVFPASFLVLPIATAGMLGVVSWRWIPIVWAVAGVVIAIAAVLVLEADKPLKVTSEWVTPMLAGTSLGAGSFALAEIDNVEIEGSKILAGALVCLGAGLACFLVMRISAEPSFNANVLRQGLLRVLLIGVVLISLIQILTFVSIAIQYFYDLSPLQASIVIAPAQIGAILGAKFLARRAVHRWGTSRAGRGLILVTGLTMLPLVTMQSNTPIWLLVLISSIFSCAGMGALTVLNMDVMGRAPADHTGEVSAFRTAASSVGTALGMALLGTMIIASVQMEAGVESVSAGQLDALANAIRVDGILGFLVSVVGWAILLVAERKTTALASV
jgi:MFS family permease